MQNQFVEMRDDAYWVRGTRVSLDSVVIAFQQGFSAENIATECFPSLTREQVNGAIAYYLAHRDEIDLYLQRAEEEFELLRKATHEANAPLVARLAEARRRLLTPQG
jgi:uncharacterized protein (DUF433 family)